MNGALGATAFSDWFDPPLLRVRRLRLQLTPFPSKVIESREVGVDGRSESPSQGVPQTPGGTRLQTRGGRSVQSSVLVSTYEFPTVRKCSHNTPVAEFNRFGWV
jgi:hypothetical protein